MSQRKIIHVDMDAFFASVEQRDFPELRGKPIAVGGSSKGGVVAAASYEARQFGVFSAMPSRLAKQKCPQLIFVKHRFDVYREVSLQIRQIFHEYTDLVEPLSLDEAFLDITENKANIESAIQIARDIKEKIKDKTSLTASAGVSVNKFLAKVASDIHKPDGLTVILPENVLPFLEELPIGKFFGVGKKTADKMKRMGIETGLDLKQYSKLELAQLFGKFGLYLYDIVRGKDDRPVKPQRIRKSISNENTYVPNLLGREAIDEAMNALMLGLERSAKKRNLKGRTINVKIRDKDFNTITRSKTVPLSTNRFDEIATIVQEILDASSLDQPIRLLGVGLSNLDRKSQTNQLKFDFYQEEEE